MASPSFVDGLWKQLQDAFAPHAEKRLARFIRQRHVTKWIIAADFCVEDLGRPNDSFAFVILPAGERFEETQDFLRRIPKRDLKQVKRAPQSIVRLLRKGRVFSICFVADRERRLFTDASWARRSMDETIAMMKSWKNASELHDVIQQFERARNELNKKSINLKLLANIILTASFAAFIAALLSKHGSAELIGWVPDRDKITEAYDKIGQTMFWVNVSAICQQFSIREPKLGLFHQTDDDLWCDPFIRIADYLAGAGAAGWDQPQAKLPIKVAKFIKDVFPDNPYLFIFPIAFGMIDGQFRCFVFRAKISKKPFGPHQQGKGRTERTAPIRGRSRQTISS
jgi:hypothetical protein